MTPKIKTPGAAPTAHEGINNSSLPIYTPPQPNAQGRLAQRYHISHAHALVIAEILGMGRGRLATFNNGNWGASPCIYSSHMTTREASAYLRLSTRTLERYRQEMTGPCLIRLGRRVFYDKVDLDQWREENKTI